MKQFNIRAIEALSNGKETLVTQVDPVKEYRDNNYTDKVIGTRYTVVFPGNGYEKVTIKTDEIYPSITMEYIESINGPIPVVVEGFNCKIYADRSGGLTISCKATTVKLAVRGGDFDGITY